MKRWTYSRDKSLWILEQIYKRCERRIRFTRTLWAVVGFATLLFVIAESGLAILDGFDPMRILRDAAIVVVVYPWLLLAQFRPDLAVRLEWKLYPKKLHPSVEQEWNEMLRRVALLAGRGTPPEG